MDFGIAKAEGVQFTPEGFTLGTPYYMAPEQVLGLDVTAQADVYSFGVLSYELFTGIKPIQATNLEKLFDQILNTQPDWEPLQEAMVPPAAVDLIRKCLAKEPAQRPQGFTVICSAIEEILGPGAIRQKPLPKPAPPPAHRRSDTRELPGLLRNLPAPLRTPEGLMLLAGVATVVLIVILYVLVASLF
jgi:serine/threonine-protein kinase